MVWFQCEDCGEEVKKPKLPSHFRSCSAYKLSCIDCGVTFGRDGAQAHTQCITEAEKYGPKNGSKPSSAQTKVEKSKPNADVDINVGLSLHHPWFCSLCNTSTTSKQTLLLHADGKKHRAKAKAFHASHKQSSGTESTPNVQSVPGEKAVAENEKLNASKKKDVSTSESTNDAGQQDGAKRNVENDSNEPFDRSSKKQRLFNLSNNEVASVADNGVAHADANDLTHTLKLHKDESNKENVTKNKIKLKKLIASALESDPDGAMKIKKLQKIVISSLKESGQAVEMDQLRDMILRKVSSSSRFLVDAKVIRLVARG